MENLMPFPAKISVAEKLSWLIRHLSNGLYIHNILNSIQICEISSDIWAKPSEMSDVSDDFREHCKIHTSHVIINIT